MCGILGIASFKPIVDRSSFLIYLDTLRHRGPDDAGEWWSKDNRIGFGHRRLSIIDLSPGGHQPMTDNSGSITITFNGEIYNFKDLRQYLNTKGHHFNTASDTEVILESYKEWGTSCLNHFNGTFAFALYDSHKKELFMARDRAGEKPLFYFLDSGTLRFASELKALMADPALPKYIDHESMDCYLALGYVPGNRCILKGFNKLPPAHALCLNLNTSETTIWKYWSMPSISFESAVNPTASQLVDKLEILLEDSVRRQLLADVPVGILLSGGVDSSLITAMAVRSASKVKTFTIRFPGYKHFDETKHARLISNYFNTDHNELDASDIGVDLLPIMARQFDEPISDSSMIPTFLVSQLIRPHCTVALGGDGGDELFGGYYSHNRIVLLNHRLKYISPYFRKPISSFVGNIMPIGFMGREFILSLGTNFNTEIPTFSGRFDKSVRGKIISNVANWNLIADQIRAHRIPNNADALQRITRMDFENYLPEDILVKVDRASMLNSLEIRAPFLDHRIIEFAFGEVPSHLKASCKNRKILLRKLGYKIFPPEFNLQRKQGFSIPLSQWLTSGTWRDFFLDVLLSKENDFFDKKFIQGLINGQDRGRPNSERLFALVLFELWRREYKILF